MNELQELREIVQRRDFSLMSMEKEIAFIDSKPPQWYTIYGRQEMIVKRRSMINLIKRHKESQQKDRETIQRLSEIADSILIE